MNQITKKDINDENILEVLVKAGIEFEEAEVVSNEITASKRCNPADFVVILDGVYHTVEILTGPLDDDIGLKILRNFLALDGYLNFEHNGLNRIVLSFCEENKSLSKTYGNFTIKFEIISIKRMALDKKG